MACREATHVARLRRRPVPEPDVIITVRMTEAERMQLHDEAHAHKLSLNNYIRARLGLATRKTGRRGGRQPRPVAPTEVK